MDIINYRIYPNMFSCCCETCEEGERKKKLARDNRSMQLNPNNWRYWSSRQNQNRRQ